jgi:hypothetical protein
MNIMREFLNTKITVGAWEKDRVRSHPTENVISQTDELEMLGKKKQLAN